MDKETSIDDLRRNIHEKPHPNFSNSISNEGGISSSIHHRNLRKIAKKIYDIRSKREQFFSTGLFSDPAWDILLDLYLAEEEQKKIYITSACIAAGVPTSTGLRWITILIQNGYIDRHEDPADARRSFLRLTSSARDALEALLSQFSDG